MADSFLDRGELGAAVAELVDSDDDTPAVICGGDEAALAVARGLTSQTVPTAIADADATDVAWRSNAVDRAGAVADPATDPEGFRADLAEIAAAAGEVVAVPCSAAATRPLVRDAPDDVVVPYGHSEPTLVALDVELLYGAADEVGVDRPETHVVAGADGQSPLPIASPEDTAASLGYPVECLAPAGNWLEEAVGADPFVATDGDDLARAVATAEDRDRRLLVRERIDVDVDRRVATHIDEGGDTTVEATVSARLGGRHGRPCLMDVSDDLDDGLDAGEGAVRLLEALGYEGLCAIRLAETTDGRTLLLDATPFPPHWLQLVSDADRNLPYAAHVEATGIEGFTPDPSHGCRWIDAAAYLRYLGAGGPDRLTTDQWRACLGGRYHYALGLSAAVLHDSDVEPMYGLIRRELGVE
jgi:hypothetical protein